MPRAVRAQPRPCVFPRGPLYPDTGQGKRAPAARLLDTRWTPAPAFR